MTTTGSHDKADEMASIPTESTTSHGGADPFAKNGLHDIEAVLKARGVDAFYRAVQGWTEDGYALLDGREVVMAGSNDYLGLSRHPRVLAAAVEAIGRYGTSVSGSRALNGTIELHEALEARLARFLGQEAAAVATTGFQAGLALSAALGRDDVAFGDIRNHASLVDGMRMGLGTVRSYRHCDPDHLRQRLRASAGPGGRLVVTDGVFSMEGDAAPLRALREVADEFGARLIVDSAHDFGVLGRSGAGLTESAGLTDRVDLIIVTMSKALGSTGGVIAGPAANVRQLRYNARSLLFSAALPPASAAAALAALDVLEAEPERRDRLHRLSRLLHDGLRAIGFDTRPSTTPIVPVTFPDVPTAGAFWAGLCEAGVITNLSGPPAAKRAMLRVTVTAALDTPHVERVLRAFSVVAERLGTPRADEPLPPVELTR
ncbi:pyridoxal phosphate-dependent aminotransferase family protein [Actinoplanes sp. TRM 88003]|uniref:8-amino-7-oxononanoate synthase n=1 Tax=Paractinoplanes aksuensis TaxID=2939490 RepID=A0ABT1E4F0_9ACTN|nr:pyridoxal phosphate-dependent aminotransferase family protein [Actinoplanes aksuensis]MCO8277994.1 pyridoxal phosphate-dependent aminotransferase family protein [Actinoplanes aksuensis]